MKVNAVMSTKHMKLQRRLNISACTTTGILERLWILTAQQAPQGDIGKLSNEDICAFIDWRGKDDVLIDALVGCGWLDRSDVHRLLVHDWHDHCPKYIKGNLVSHGKEFLTKQPAKQAAKQSAKQSAKQDLSGTSELVPIQSNPIQTNSIDNICPSDDGRPADKILKPDTILSPEDGQSKLTKANVQWMVDQWNNKADSRYPRVEKMNPSREKSVRRCWNEIPKVAAWLGAISYQNNFNHNLEGRYGFDTMIRPSNYVKYAEAGMQGIAPVNESSGFYEEFDGINKVQIF